LRWKIAKYSDSQRRVRIGGVSYPDLRPERGFRYKFKWLLCAVGGGKGGVWSSIAAPRGGTGPESIRITGDEKIRLPGRLTPDVLLSFAQFERAVTSDRRSISPPPLRSRLSVAGMFAFPPFGVGLRWPASGARENGVVHDSLRNAGGRYPIARQSCGPLDQSYGRPRVWLPAATRDLPSSCGPGTASRLPAGLPTQAPRR
jgi:hypothetical protein